MSVPEVVPADDELLLELLERPSRTAWSRFYDFVSARLKLYTFSLLRTNGRLSSDEAEDIVQEVLTRFVEKFHRYEVNIRSLEPLRNYLIKSCRNEVATRLRRLKVREGSRELLELTVSEVLSERSRAALQRVENRKILELVLQKVNPQCQKLLIFYLFDRGTLSDYATAANLPVGTVYSQWHRCITELRSLVAKGSAEP